MKKLLTISTLAILAACGEKQSESTEQINILENLTFSVDTVVIDVGEEIFMPGAYSAFAISEEEDRVFTFYEPEVEVHEIDLNNNKLVARHKFEKDGPNMIPNYANYLQVLNDDELFLGNFYTGVIFTLDGKKVKSLPFQAEKYSGFDPDFSMSMGNSITLSSDKKTALFYPNEGIGAPDGLAILNADEMSGELVALPALEMSENFRIKMSDGSITFGQLQKISWVNEQFILYSGTTSDIYLYDQTDSLRLVTFPHQLVPKMKTGEFPSTADTYERLREVGREIDKQITFSNFYWDKTRQMYFRLAQMNWEVNEEAQSFSADIYLFSYDKDFNLTGEAEVEGLDALPFQSFMKNGKLYSRWVVGENPAFIVYSFDF
ncbi:protein of unknown function [Algoriphagus locisalis]|uniref:DUF4221 domain-containing protein n=1 Tax=Algoriphagus locisalis TaxID=305507 RepID=A0A1I7ANI3_9BACT|nr:DUF4221 family protein [Algoriphagus locisalis]SFT76497.1 protein of unknown function [Algoriphagus locisalis]